MSFTAPEFRRALARFATGVTVVTTVFEDKFYGLTVSAFCSVSLNPFLVLISIEKTSQTHDILHKSQVYAVNILTIQQQYLSERFARKDVEGGKTFDDIKLHTAETGAPLFDEALAYIDCHVVAEYDGGDHTIFLGEVVNLYYNDQVDPVGQELPPLLYFRSHYCTTQELIEAGVQRAASPLPGFEVPPPE